MAEKIEHKNSGIQVISRAAEILRALASDTNGLSLGQIAKRTELPRSTVQRIVSALSVEGLVSAQNGYGGIKLGAEIHALAQAVSLDMRQKLKPMMQAIADQTGETVDLAILDGDQMLFLDQVVGSHRLRTVSSIGEHFPLTTTANGKAALAQLPQDQAHRAILAEFKTLDTARSLAAILAEIEDIRAGELALDNGEHTDGICAFGFAVRDHNGDVYAVSTPVPASRFERVKPVLSQALLGAKREIVA